MVSSPSPSLSSLLAVSSTWSALPTTFSNSPRENETATTSSMFETSNEQLEQAAFVAATSALSSFKDFIAVLFECVTIISLGYLSGRFKLISPEAKDLGSYLTTFALPMIIFLNIAQMEFQTINLSFLFCMLIAKLFLFIIVTILTLAVSYPTNYAYAGALSILATQSNDFALGYPLVKSLYGETKPEMLSYLSLMAPIQLLILNPLGVVMLEYEKSRKRKSRPTLGSATGPHNDNNNNGCQFCQTNRPLTDSHLRDKSVTSSDLKQNHKQQISPISRISGPAPDQRQQSSSQPQPTAPPTTLSPPAQSMHVTTKQTNSNQLIMNPDKPLVGYMHPRDVKRSQPSRFSGGDQRNNLTTSAISHSFHHHHQLHHQPQTSRRRNIKSLTLVMPARSVICSKTSKSSDDQPNSLLQASFTGTNHHHQRGLNYSFRPLSPVAKCNYPSTSENKSIPCDNDSPNKIIDSHSIAVSETSKGHIDHTNRCTCLEPRDDSVINLNFLKALATNPLIVASVVALVVNLINGPELPKIVTRVSNTIAASFAAPALFVVGLSMYGKFELLLRNPNDLLLASILVATKVLVLPSIMRTFALIILPKYAPGVEVPYLTDFSYLYGLLPTAPTVCIIAKQYGVLINVVSITMLLSTFISAPLMIGSSFIIKQVTAIKADEFEYFIGQTLKFSSTITLLLCTLTLYSLWKSGKHLNYVNLVVNSEVLRKNLNRIKTSSTHLFLLLLAITQLIVGIGGFMWLFMDFTTTNNRPVISGIGMDNRVDRWFDDIVEESDLIDVISGGQIAQETAPVGGNQWITIALTSHSFSFKALCTIQYVLSSAGLLLARFVILSIIVIIYAKNSRGHVVAAKVAKLMIKVIALLAFGLVAWLIFELKQLKCIPSESSIPNQPMSMYLRLIYDLNLLIISIPLFSMIFKAENKNNWKKLHEFNGDEQVVFAKRRFVTSNASLSSDTSSEMTLNTNVESPTPPIVARDKNQTQILASDSVSVVIEAKNLDSLKDPFPSISSVESVDADPHPEDFCSYNSANDNHDIHINDDLVEDHHNRCNMDESSINNCADIHTDDTSMNLSTEFHRNAILIVSVLIQITLSLTTVIQIFCQDKPFGTFRQVELTNVAVDFGQGLLTFLVIGMKGLFR